MALSVGKVAFVNAMKGLSAITDPEQQEQAINDFVNALITLIQTAKVDTTVAISGGVTAVLPHPPGGAAVGSIASGAGTGVGTLT